MAVYKYCIQKNLRFETEYDLGWFENEWLKLEGHAITIYGKHLTGYAWDGCSVKWTWLDLYFGTPDGVVSPLNVAVVGEDGYFTLERENKPKTWDASLVHDILYQFKGDHGVSRATADLVFREMLEARGFKLARVYYGAVRLFGGLFGKWSKE